MPVLYYGIMKADIPHPSRRQRPVLGAAAAARPLSELKVLFKLFSEEIRIRILCLLQAGELNVSEMQQILKLKQSNLSSHLNQLKEQRILTSRREGQHSYYQLAQHGKQVFPALVHEVVRAAKRELWYAKDQQLRRQIMETRQKSALAYFQTSAAKAAVAPGQELDVLAVGFLGDWRGRVVVDLGCGTGRIARLYALAGAQVTGVDISSQQLQEAAQREQTLFANDAAAGASACTQQPIRYLCESMEATSLPAGEAALVVLSHALHHAPQPRDVLREAWRLLQPDGQLLVIELTQHHNESLRARFGDFWLGFDAPTFKTWLNDLGFIVCRYTVLQHYQCEERVTPFVLSAVKPAAAAMTNP